MNKFTKEEIAQGYVDMGDINLSISKESFHLESEVMKLGDDYYGVGTETSEENSK